MNNKGKENVALRSFVTAIAVILALMVLTYVLTLVIPAGEYGRVLDENGNTVIDKDAGFSYTEGGIPFWKWLLSPVLVVGADGGGTLIAIIAFLLVIGGVFQSLDECGLMKYMLSAIVARFGKRKYRLLAVVTFFFMMMGALIGSFEECVPLVPIVVSLAVSLGWDELCGLGMSLLAVGCGFAAGVCNPFTVGVAQELAGLPMFSGMWLRALSFAVIYAVLMLFLTARAKKLDSKAERAASAADFKREEKMDRALVCFASILGVGILSILVSSIIPAMQDYTMIIVAAVFLLAGVVSVKVCRVGWGDFGRSFWRGVVNILPAVLLILMAGSIKYTLTEAKILDTVLHFACESAMGMPRFVIILFIYLIVLVMNFFISSGSAKAFLLMPLIVPMAQLFGISPQLCVVAFAFGDGFSNVFYPTNAALLISLGLANVSYVKWAKYTFKIQMAILAVTSLILVFGLAVGYN